MAQNVTRRVLLLNGNIHRQQFGGTFIEEPARVHEAQLVTRITHGDNDSVSRRLGKTIALRSATFFVLLPILSLTLFGTNEITRFRAART